MAFIMKKSDVMVMGIIEDQGGPDEGDLNRSNSSSHSTAEGTSTWQPRT
jgi:hypothetical protein